MILPFDPASPLHRSLAVVAGAAIVAVLILVLRRRGKRYEQMAWSTGLLVAALIYVVFALAGGAPIAGHLREWIGVAIYAAFALAGRRHGWAVGVGWWFHVLWDLLHGTSAAWVPAWYPWACLGFDVFLGCYLIVRLRPCT